MIYIVNIIMCGLLVSCAQVVTTVETEKTKEQAIVQLIEGIVTAYNTRNLEAQLAAYAADARIESLAARGAPLSRDQYATLRRTWTPRGTVYVRALSVTILSADTAEATALFRLVNGDQNILGRRAFRLARRSGQWLVVDARFVGPIPWGRK